MWNLRCVSNRLVQLSCLALLFYLFQPFSDNPITVRSSDLQKIRPVRLFPKPK